MKQITGSQKRLYPASAAPKGFVYACFLHQSKWKLIMDASEWILGHAGGGDACVAVPRR